jgi:hypothetical protein
MTHAITVMNLVRMDTCILIPANNKGRSTEKLV